MTRRFERLDFSAPVCTDCGEPINRQHISWGGAPFHRDCLTRVQAEMSQAEWLDLGTLNGLPDLPKELQACHSEGHNPSPLRQYRSDEHWRVYQCGICRIKYSVDES